MKIEEMLKENPAVARVLIEYEKIYGLKKAREMFDYLIEQLVKIFKSYARELVPEELKEIYNYYLSTRGVGHTYSMMEGAKNTDCLVVCANKQQEREVGKQLLGKKTTTLANIKQELRGIKKPLLIDHYALCCLIGEMLRRIEEW